MSHSLWLIDYELSIFFRMKILKVLWDGGNVSRSIWRKWTENRQKLFCAQPLQCVGWKAIPRLLRNLNRNPDKIRNMLIKGKRLKIHNYFNYFYSQKSASKTAFDGVFKSFTYLEKWFCYHFEQHKRWNSWVSSNKKKRPINFYIHQYFYSSELTTVTLTWRYSQNSEIVTVVIHKVGSDFPEGAKVKCKCGKRMADSKHHPNIVENKVEIKVIWYIRYNIYRTRCSSLLSIIAENFLSATSA